MDIQSDHHKLSVPIRTTINSQLSLCFTQPKTKLKMKSFVAVLCLVASAAAGGQFGYSTAQGTTHAVGVSAVHAAPVAYAAPAAIAAPVAYAQPALAYAAPAVKTIAPVAQSAAFVNRAPAARIAVAAPVAYAQPAIATYGAAVAPAGVAYGATYGAALAGPALY